MCMLFSGLTVSSFANVQVRNVVIEQNLLMNTSGSYSWNAVFGALSYTVDLENVVTNQKFHYETSGTSVSLGGIPSGTYVIVVRAKFANGSSIIIIEEIIS